MNFAVSTTAFREQPIDDIIALATEERLYLEFSSGLPSRPDMESLFKQAPCRRLPHNYFPAPQKPFVLNLASLRDEVREASVAHCINGLRLAAAVKAPFYSAHAGYCVDPKPADLGRKLPTPERRPRQDYWTRFVDSVKTVVGEARSLGVRFLVENNVVAGPNVAKDATHSLLCASLDEIVQLLQEVNSPDLRILLDTGHLKVSAMTLGFSKEDCVRALIPHIGAVHHSDNNGQADTNEPLQEGYWFLPFMPHFADAFHILEVHDQTVPDIRRQQRLLEDATRRPAPRS